MAQGNQQLRFERKLVKQIYKITLSCAFLSRGKSDSLRPKTKIAMLLTTDELPNWNRTLELGNKAKDMGISLVLTAWKGSIENREKFTDLASPRMAFFFENETDHLQKVHQFIDEGILCRLVQS